MNRLITQTPLIQLPNLSRYLKVDLRVKRDDLFPVAGGGNKARKMASIIKDVEARGCDAIVTTGGLQSNHARVCALEAASHGWPCKLVLHGNIEETHSPQGNYLLMRLAGADTIVVEPAAIAQAMQSALQELKHQGYRPYEIPGGGHSVVGALAYVDAISELEEQCRKDKWQPEWIIHASGTGATQAGLVLGLERRAWPTNLVGVSVARRNPGGRDVVESMCRELRAHFGVLDAPLHVDFRDSWVGEGYERADISVLTAIKTAAQLEGLMLDPTYTGKAFVALHDLVDNGEIETGARVLFWHTGGLLNLLASGHYIEEILG